MGMQDLAAAVKNSTKIPQKLKIELLYDSEISLLDIYPKELKLGKGILALLCLLLHNSQ